MKTKLINLIVKEVTASSESSGSEEYDSKYFLNKNNNSDDDENEDIIDKNYDKVKNIKESIDKDDWIKLKKIIRMEIAVLFFDLYKKKNVWL